MLGDNVLHQSLPPIFINQTMGSTAKTAPINLEGANFLTLDIDYTQVSATAIVFAFSGDGIGSSNSYVLTETTYGAGTIRDAAYTYSTIGTGAQSRKFFFNISGIGNTGNITLSITFTGGTTDSITQCVPYACAA